MNAVFFGLKRTYHSTLRVFRRALASLGLTAARFDLLYILLKERGLLQRELQRALGVAASTVSRMLGSLEELGLVVRHLDEDDCRRRHVELTKEGRRSVIRAARLLIHSGLVDLTIDSALSPNRWYDLSARWTARPECLRPLRLLSYAYGDRATPNYPFVSIEEGEGIEEDEDTARDVIPPVWLGATDIPTEIPTEAEPR
jgi:DNA-binding MarR family transcriptional regulator